MPNESKIIYRWAYKYATIIGPKGFTEIHMSYNSARALATLFDIPIETDLAQ